jgi:hypothetical protein
MPDQSFIQRYIIGIWVPILVACLVSAVDVAYQYLTSSNFNWTGALSAFVATFIISLTHHINITNTKDRISAVETQVVDTRPTIHTQAVNPDDF